MDLDVGDDDRLRQLGPDAVLRRDTGRRSRQERIDRGRNQRAVPHHTVPVCGSPGVRHLPKVPGSHLRKLPGAVHHGIRHDHRQGHEPASGRPHDQERDGVPGLGPDRTPLSVPESVFQLLPQRVLGAVVRDALVLRRPDAVLRAGLS